ATELGLLVRDGPKRATASLRSAYEDGEPIPRAGELSVILDGDGDPLCVIRTTHVEIRRFADVDEEFAWAEGEGDRSLAYWRRAPTGRGHGVARGRRRHRLGAGRIAFAGRAAARHRHARDGRPPPAGGLLRPRGVRVHQAPADRPPGAAGLRPPAARHVRALA